MVDEMRNEVVGPPSYGSPDPRTSGGRLVSVKDHPLSEDIAEDYGKGYEPVAGAEGGSGEATEDGGYESWHVDQLKEEAELRGLDVPAKAKKADLVKLLEDDDAENA